MWLGERAVAVAADRRVSVAADRQILTRSTQRRAPVDPEEVQRMDVYWLTDEPSVVWQFANAQRRRMLRSAALGVVRGRPSSGDRRHSAVYGQTALIGPRDAVS
jgi:hypothetical protein